MVGISNLKPRTGGNLRIDDEGEITSCHESFPPSLKHDNRRKVERDICLIDKLESGSSGNE